MQRPHSTPTPAAPRNIAARAGRWSAEHKKTAIAAWFVFVCLALVAGGQVGQRQITNSEAGDGESLRAQRAVVAHGLQQPATENVLISSDRYTAGDAPFDRAVRDVTDRVAALSIVSGVRSPARGNGPVSGDGRAALVSFAIKGDPDKAEGKVTPVLKAVGAARAANPRVRVQQFGDASVMRELNGVFSDDLARARNLSLPITLIILVFAFGSLVAAGIPVLLAITAVMAAIGLVAIPSQISPVDQSVAEVILLIGMAVGVDYSLFYLKREREERAKGMGERAAILAAAATSGRAVLVSGATVIAAMAGMLIAGDKTFISFGVGTMLVVAIAMVGSVSVLPALLSALGDRVDKGAVPVIAKRRRQALARGESGGVWSAIVERVLRRPVVSAACATALLVAMAVPALQLHTQTSGVSDLPANLSTVRAYNAIQRAFPSKNVSADVVYVNNDVRSRGSLAAIARFKSRVAATSGLLPVSEVRVSRDGRAAKLTVPIAQSSNEDAAEAAVRNLRSAVIPGTLGGAPGARVYVAGMAASSIDFTAQLKRRGPIVFAFVLTLAFLLLLVTFRSLVIPLKAIVLNLMSVAAAYGVLVLVFQHGWGASLLGVDHTTAIAPWLPLFLFVILFGLSMDYHVFILSRIREAHDEGRDTREAVAFGIRSTAGVVTSAATVMVAVFAVFGTVSVIALKQMGVGLAAAVLIDATVIRAVLLPAAMTLLGEANWYLPRWLEWLPRVGGEAPAGDPATARPTAPPAQVAAATMAKSSA